MCGRNIPFSLLFFFFKIIYHRQDGCLEKLVRWEKIKTLT